MVNENELQEIEAHQESYFHHGKLFSFKREKRNESKYSKAWKSEIQAAEATNENQPQMVAK